MKVIRFAIPFCILILAFQVRYFGSTYGFMFRSVNFNISFFVLVVLSILLTIKAVIAVIEESD